MPESITATFTGASAGRAAQADHALSCIRYHCCAASGSVLSNASAAGAMTTARRKARRAPRRCTATWYALRTVRRRRQAGAGRSAVRPLELEPARAQAEVVTELGA